MNWMLGFICFFKLSSALAPATLNLWMIWNVGQGQWVSKIEFDRCTHFDFGGENFALKEIRPLFQKLCVKKENRLHLSHGDLDHYSFYNFIASNSASTCWLNQVPDDLRRLQTDSPLCSSFPSEMDTFIPAFTHQKNDSSIVVHIEDFLLPGDSPKKREQVWKRHLKNQNPISYLLLGHHGSRTSTSDELLKALPNLKMAFASARFRKYGHPHQQVVERLRRFKIPLIKTEDFGNILIQRN